MRISKILVILFTLAIMLVACGGESSASQGLEPTVRSAQSGSATVNCVDAGGTIVLPSGTTVMDNVGGSMVTSFEITAVIHRLNKTENKMYFNQLDGEHYVLCNPATLSSTPIPNTPSAVDPAAGAQASGETLPTCPEGDQDGQYQNHPSYQTQTLVNFLLTETSWGQSGQLIIQNFEGDQRKDDGTYYTLDNNLAFAFTQPMVDAKTATESNRYSFANQIEGRYFSAHMSYPFLNTEQFGKMGIGDEILYGSTGYVQAGIGLPEFDEPVQPSNVWLDYFAEDLLQSEDKRVEDVAQSLEVSILRGENIISGTNYSDAQVAANAVRNRTINKNDLVQILKNMREINDWTLVIYPAGTTETEIRTIGITPWVHDHRLANCTFDSE